MLVMRRFHQFYHFLKSLRQETVIYGIRKCKFWVFSLIISLILLPYTSDFIMICTLVYTKNSKNLQIALAFFSELSLYIRNPNLLKFLKLVDFFLMATHFCDNHFLLYMYTSAPTVEPSGVTFTTVNFSSLLLLSKILLTVRTTFLLVIIFHSLNAEFPYSLFHC